VRAELLSRLKVIFFYHAPAVNQNGQISPSLKPQRREEVGAFSHQNLTNFAILPESVINSTFPSIFIFQKKI